MSEFETSQDVPSKPRKETTYENVTMEDGRTTQFAGERKTDKTIIADDSGLATGVRFDFRNGATRSLYFNELSQQLLAYAAGHGISQKAGDEYSGVKEVDDMVLAVEEIFERLRRDEWAAARTAGESTAGASVVIRALMEVTGKDQATIKTFLQGKLDRAKEAGQKLSRQELYNSFRNMNTKTGPVIKRMEEERATKVSKVDAGGLLDELDELAT